VQALYGEQRQVVRTRVDGRPYRAVSVTALGRQIAPPVMPRFPVSLIVSAGLLSLCLSGSVQSLSESRYADESAPATIVSLAAVGLVLWLVIRILRHRNRLEPQVRIAERLWQHTWCCRRCGIAWVWEPALPRALWGRPFRTTAMTAQLGLLARNILAHRARTASQDNAAPRSAGT
jgi:hypothetical protein